MGDFLSKVIRGTTNIYGVNKSSPVLEKCDFFRLSTLGNYQSKLTWIIKYLMSYFKVQ